jgi:hypothetical protein
VRRTRSSSSCIVASVAAGAVIRRSSWTSSQVERAPALDLVQLGRDHDRRPVPDHPEHGPTGSVSGAIEAQLDVLALTERSPRVPPPIGHARTLRRGSDELHRCLGWWKRPAVSRTIVGHGGQGG